MHKTIIKIEVFENILCDRALLSYLLGVTLSGSLPVFVYLTTDICVILQVPLQGIQTSFRIQQFGRIIFLLYRACNMMAHILNIFCNETSELFHRMSQ